MENNHRPSLREIIGNRLKNWGNKLQENPGEEPLPRIEASIPLDSFFSIAVNQIKTELTLDSVLDLQTESEKRLYREQLIIESARKILTDPFFVHPATGLPLKIEPYNKQKKQEIYCKPRRSTDITDMNLVKLEGEIAAAAKTTATKLLSPEYQLYGQILVEQLVGDSLSIPTKQLKIQAEKDRETFREDLALQKHAEQIAHFRNQAVNMLLFSSQKPQSVF